MVCLNSCIVSLGILPVLQFVYIELKGICQTGTCFVVVVRRGLWGDLALASFVVEQGATVCGMKVLGGVEDRMTPSGLGFGVLGFGVPGLGV